jgi:hypothetical protein
MSSKCRVLASIVLAVITSSISVFEYNSAFSQTIDNVPFTNNGAGGYETPINIPAVVKDTADSMKIDLQELNKSIQNGDVPNAIKKINDLNESVSTLQACVTSTPMPSPLPTPTNQTSTNQTSTNQTSN